jgi:hypothetical protein
MEATLSALVHGEEGVGKSWLGASTPVPRLILDSEGRAKYTPGRKIYWDPRATEPPAYDGTWDTCIVQVLDFDTYELVYRWLRSGQHPFVSATVDSLMEGQKRGIDQIAGVQQMDQQDWGQILRKIEGLVRTWRDLVLIEGNSLRCVLFVVGSKSYEGKYQPLLQGQIRDTIAYLLDVVGFMYVPPAAEGVPDSAERALLVKKLPGYTSKDNTGKLPGPVIYNPDITELMRYLENGNGGAVAPTQEVTA